MKRQIPFPALQSPETRAQQALGDLVDAGAMFQPTPPHDSLPASFTYELRPGGDRTKCRSIIAETKADPVVWSALIREIATRSAVAA